MSSTRDIKDIARRLLSRLRVEMNGAVSAAMRSRGIDYRLNFGVSLPTISDIASAYYGDNELADYLYHSDIRELRLAAIYIVDPDAMTVEQLDTWAVGVVNNEIAEQLAVKVISRVDFGFDKALEWIERDDINLNYAGAMSVAALARRYQRENIVLETSYREKFVALIDRMVESAAIHNIMWYGTMNSMAAMAALDNDLHGVVEEWVEKLKKRDNQRLQQLSSEIEWQL